MAECQESLPPEALPLLEPAHLIELSPQCARAHAFGMSQPKPQDLVGAGQSWEVRLVAMAVLAVLAHPDFPLA